MREIIRQNSKKLLEHDTGNVMFHIEDCIRENLAFNQYLSLILLHHPAMQARYTVHFMLNDAINLAAIRSNTAPTQVTKERAVDYFKEYCNVLAGNVTRDLGTSGVRFVHSLPFAIQGYNDIFFPLNEQDTFCDAFYLTSDICRVGISLDITVTDLDGLAPLKGIDMSKLITKPFGGDFEML